MASPPSQTVQVEVLFFAKARELAEASSIRLALPEHLTGSQCRRALEEAFPALRALRGGYVLALNEEYVEAAEHGKEEDQQQKLRLKEADEIAVIPPISGG